MEAAMPPSFIDLVEQNLGGMDTAVHAVSADNLIRIVDTPHIWGQPMDASAGALAKQSVQSMADTVETIIGTAERHVDVVSLNPPTGVFQKAVENGLLALAERSKSSPITVRFLFGYVVVYDTMTTFVQRISAVCRDNKLPMTNLNIVIGQLSTKFVSASWNHAKIVAADGHIALVGGHNLWDEAYGTYPPVHDVSVQVYGDAAAHAQQFTEWLWQTGGTILIAKKINATYGVDTLAPGTDRDRLTLIKPAPPTAQQKAPRTVVGEAFEEPEEDDPGWVKGRVLALGRGGALGHNASDVAKEQIILNAQRTLKICQQDLLFTGAFKEREHLVCHWIANALLANTELEVQVIISPIDASGGQQQYSWGSGAVGTHELFKRLLTEKSKSSPKGQADTALVADAMKRLKVAPFCFTNVTFTAEGTDYRWPAPPPGSRIGRMGTTIPTPSLANHDPAPGLHAKVYIADDSVYYVGSDNLYPHNLMEFGYLVEGPACAAFIRDYWTPAWSASAPHAIKNK
ncbi:hypothetical protein ACGFNU_12840 [Spirillospora sp. NPDC048911]|uniref:hypothetical protein n=1 Tax=Spirillospora sp. NPDC048911 TaxID=3364527 RepID=UPI00371500EF